jgi:basic membrane lipoprotein Med (substrate-binding protein (PBP1-ABC) superfamily)
MIDWSNRAAPPSGKRRSLLTALAASPLVAACQGTFEGPERGPLAVLFLDRIKDNESAEEGHLGLLRMTQQFNMPFQFVEGIGTEREAVLNALRELASSTATMIVVHGGAASEAVQRAAWEFPRKRFTLIQGDRIRPNLASYRVRESNPPGWPVPPLHCSRSQAR